MADGPPRIPPVSPESYSEELKTFFGGLEESGFPSGIRRLNIVRTLANHPDLTMAYMAFGSHILGRSSLSPRVRELATLRTAWLCGSDYEWERHAQRARRSGMSEQEVEGVKSGSDSPVWPDFERHVLRAVEQLRSDMTIEDDVWEVLSEHLDQSQLLDFVFTVGCYMALALALNSLRVERD